MSNRRAKVLVVDADLEGALSLHRGLYAAARDFDVLLAGSAEIAQDIMRDLPVDILVTETNLPGMSGVDLVCWAAVESPETLLVVMTGARVAELQERMRGLGCLRLLGKPCKPREVLQIVREGLESRDRLSGSFAALSASDLIQMLCLGQRTVCLRIAAEGTGGTVVIVKGKLVHATWGDMVGEKAVCHIIAAEDGVFRTTPILDKVAPTIAREWQHVLMDAVRSLDEVPKNSQRSSGTLPAIRVDDSTLEDMLPGKRSDDGQGSAAGKGDVFSDARFVPRTPGVASSLVDKGFAALRAGNLDEARQCWEAAQKLDPENRSLDLNLRKLQSMLAR